MALLHRGLISIAIFFVAPLTLAAAPPPPPALTAPDTALVARASAYLQSLTTAKGRFTQTDTRGQVTQGTVWVQRPGKARFEYDPPSGLVIASDGHEVSVVDRRLKTIQSYPLGLTPLALLLARDIRLDKGVTVTQVARFPHAFAITARDGRKKAQGQIVLYFADAPIALTGWALTDAQGRTVRVRLSVNPAPPREARFFELYDPTLRSGLGSHRPSQ
ncbi:MAG: outer membrane lipoprotein carrier protein LolA [Pseudomonadota bacterium]|nr:outer membrane lipoprotein carrier protein LolA [Pseudomonadota bacterium]